MKRKQNTVRKCGQAVGSIARTCFDSVMARDAMPCNNISTMMVQWIGKLQILGDGADSLVLS